MLIAGLREDGGRRKQGRNKRDRGREETHRLLLSTVAQKLQLANKWHVPFPTWVTRSSSCCPFLDPRPVAQHRASFLTSRMANNS
jgi:hypothetical protein